MPIARGIVFFSSQIEGCNIWRKSICENHKNRNRNIGNRNHRSHHLFRIHIKYHLFEISNHCNLSLLRQVWIEENGKIFKHPLTCKPYSTNQFIQGIQVQVIGVRFVQMTAGLCIVCLDYSKCSSCLCGGGFYCSRECQAWDWAMASNRHKHVCPIQALRDAWQTTALPKELLGNVFSFIGKCWASALRINETIGT